MKEVKIMPLCPIHKTQLLDTNDKILQKNNGKTYDILVFFCKTCGRYMRGRIRSGRRNNE